jgi:PAS domain S-box-containing protein
MDGTLGKRALGLLRSVMGRRESDRSPTRPDPGLDVVEQAVERAIVGGAMPSAPAGAVGASEADRAEATRRELEAALARIFTSAADAIFTIDVNQRILMFNRAAEQLFGCPASQALGASASRFIPEQLLTEDTDRERRAAETGVAGWRLGEVTPLTALRSDGQRIPVDATVTPVTVRGEQLFTAVIRDVSPRVQMEEQLREVNRRLEQALADVQHTQEVMLRQERLKALGQLASGIAHDFNNALSMIIGFTELLLSDVAAMEDAAKRRAHLQLIHSAAQDAAGVVGRLREFSRPTKSSAELPPIQINDVVAQAISLSQPRWRDQAQAAGTTIRVAADLGQVPLIGGRAAELREALANLIINAVDAMPAGGTLTLRTRLETGLDKGLGEGMVVVEVSDTGTGMPPEVRDRIFDPFYTTKGDRGTGLGLAMVHGIVEQHHGEISVQSEIGRGTTFTMRFRPLPERVEPSVVTARPAPPRVRGLRVLLTEDEPSLRQILTSYLRVDGHAIEAAGNGQEALAKFRPDAFDLVITDRAMPEMGGDQLAAELERRGSTTPVIMLTGLGDLMNEVGERPEGVDLVVAKPVTLAELRAAVMLVTSESRAS